MAGIITNGTDESRACSYVSASAPTAITAGTPVKIAGTMLAGGCVRGFTIGDNKATYIGCGTAWFHINAFISMTSDTNNVTFSFYVAKNGAIISQSKIRRKVGTGADVGALTIQANVEMTDGDYVEMWADADISNNLTVSEMTTAISSIGT